MVTKRDSLTALIAGHPASPSRFGLARKQRGGNRSNRSAFRLPGGRFTLLAALALVVVVVGSLIAFHVLNPQNPAYDAEARGQLDSQTQVMTQEGSLDHAWRWQRLMRSPSTECHFKSSKPQEFMVSGSLTDEYIEPGTEAIRWYVRFETNLQPQLFGVPRIQGGVATMQAFYAIVNQEGFKACSVDQAAKAHSTLAPWL